MLTTIKQVRNLFWEQHPEFRSAYRKSYRQNDYSGNIRYAFVNFVDDLHRQGMISEKLADRVTL